MTMSPPPAARPMIVCLFALFIGMAGLFSLPPLDRDEARFAQATAQMLETGDFIAIRFQDDERNKKPAGIHWLQAASVASFSSVDAREIWAYRLPSVLGAVLGCFFTYWIATQFYGSKTGLLAGLFMACAPVLAGEATIAKTDAMLFAATTGAMAALATVFTRYMSGARVGFFWPLAFWIGMAAGVLLKGPITPMIAGLTIGVICARRKSLDFLIALRPVTGVLIVLALVGPWAAAIGAATEGRFFSEALGGDMAGKLANAQERHSGPPLYHAALLALLFWPATAMIAPGLKAAFTTRRAWPSFFLLAWIGPSWLVFELTATKLPHYALPLYPAIATLAARAAQDGAALRNRWTRRTSAALYTGVGLAAAAFIIIAPMVYADGAPGALNIALSGLIAALSLAAGYCFLRTKALQGASIAIVASAALAFILLEAVLPGLERLRVSPRVAQSLEAIDRHPLKDNVSPAALAGYFEPSAVFLLGTKTKLLDGPGAAHYLADTPDAAVVIEARMLDDFERTARSRGVRPKRDAVIEGVNYSNGKNVALTVFYHDRANATANK